MTQELSQRFSQIRPRRFQFAENVFSGAISHMYFDDWTLDLMPSDYGDSKHTFNISVSPQDQTQLLRPLFNIRGNRTRSLEESFSEFVNGIGKNVILYGGAAYELCKEDEENGELTFNEIAFDSLTLDREHVLQESEGSVIKADRQKVLLIPEPSWIEGGKGFQNTLKNLLDISRYDLRPMDVFQKQARGETTHVNVSDLMRTQKIDFLRETRFSGWPGRSLYSNEVSEFYFVTRDVKFKKAQAQFRDYIVSKIKNFLKDLSHFGLPQISIDVSGLLSPSDIDLILTKLQQGQISFRDIRTMF